MSIFIPLLEDSFYELDFFQAVVGWLKELLSL